MKSEGECEGMVDGYEVGLTLASSFRGEEMGPRFAMEFRIRYECKYASVF